MRFYKGATGLKTGTTSGAGSCLSATATRDNLSLVAVVMGCGTSDERFSSARGLLDFGFANYVSIAPPSIAAELSPVPILRGVEETVDVVYDDPGAFVVEKGTEEALTQEITIVEDVEAPVEAGQVLGKVEVVVSGEVVGSYDLRAAGDVERMTVGRAFGKLLNSLLRMNRDPNAAPRVKEEVAAEEENPATTSGEADPAAECKCGMDTCYCEEIGDVCGCTKK